MPALTLVAAVAVSLVATAAARRVAIRFGVMAHPNPIVRDHTHAVPYLGGPAILVGAWGALAASGDRLYAGLGAAAALFAVLGLVDDVAPLPPGRKFAAQTAVATTAVAVAGLVRPLTGSGPADAAIAVLVVLAAVNAMNFLDVCDGLAAAVAGVGLAFWALAPGLSPIAAPMLASTGACAGFLWWNRPPARIYMGDSGSHLVGFLLAAAALTGVPDRPPAEWLAVTTLTLAVPLFELVFISWARVRKGLPWWRGSPDHFALRLQRAGMSKSRVDAIAAGAATIACTVAATLPRERPVTLALVLLLLVAASVQCARVLWRQE